jgi:hypothetical protein
MTTFHVRCSRCQKECNYIVLTPGGQLCKACEGDDLAAKALNEHREGKTTRWPEVNP